MLVCERRRENKNRASLRRLLLTGAMSAPRTPANDAYFDELRRRVRAAGRERRSGQGGEVE